MSLILKALYIAAALLALATVPPLFFILLTVVHFVPILLEKEEFEAIPLAEGEEQNPDWSWKNGIWQNVFIVSASIFIPTVSYLYLAGNEIAARYMELASSAIEFFPTLPITEKYSQDLIGHGYSHSVPMVMNSIYLGWLVGAVFHLEFIRRTSREATKMVMRRRKFRDMRAVYKIACALVFLPGSFYVAYFGMSIDFPPETYGIYTYALQDEPFPQIIPMSAAIGFSFFLYATASIFSPWIRDNIVREYRKGWH